MARAKRDGLTDPGPVLPGFAMPALPEVSRENRKMLLAFSGGADSTALLYLLRQWAGAHGYRLYAAHVEHGIRGAESQKDQAFCRALCGEWNIPFFTASFPVPELAKKSGKSLETEARDVRYRYLYRIMDEEQIPFLLTAHHADDQAETILFHLARGAGPSGVCGIQPQQKLQKDRFLIRPLLHCTKSDILTFCRENGLEYREDRTNAENICTRNKLRHAVLPVLNEIAPGAARRMSATADMLRNDDQFLNQLAGDYMLQNSGLLQRDAATCTGPADFLSDLHPALAVRVLQELVFSLHAGEHGVESQHLTAILAHLQDKKWDITLPGGLCFSVRNGSFSLSHRPVHTEPDLSVVPVEPGVNTFQSGGHKVTLRIAQADKSGRVHTDTTCLSLSGAILHTYEPLCFRTRRPGDCLEQNGMHLEVKNLFTDAKVPEKLRGAIPLLARKDSGEVLWVPLPDPKKCRISDVLQQDRGKPADYVCTVQFD